MEKTLLLCLKQAAPSSEKKERCPRAQSLAAAPRSQNRGETAQSGHSAGRRKDSAGARDPPGARDEASTSISFQWEGKNTNVQIMNPARIVVVLVTMMTQFRICCNGGRDTRRQKCLARATLDGTELSGEMPMGGSMELGAEAHQWSSAPRPGGLITQTGVNRKPQDPTTAREPPPRLRQQVALCLPPLLHLRPFPITLHAPLSLSLPPFLPGSHPQTGARRPEEEARHSGARWPVAVTRWL